MVPDSPGMWLVIILTGVGIGVLGAWLDVLVKWCVLCWLVRARRRWIHGVGWATCGKDVARTGSSTTKLRAVAVSTVSATVFVFTSVLYATSSSRGDLSRMANMERISTR